MKIKIIDLLNKIAHGDIPEHIRFRNEDWYWGYDSYVPKKFLHTTPDVQAGVSLFKKYRIDYTLNDEIEIIEGNHNKIGFPSLEDRYCKLLLENEELKKWIDKLETREEPKKIEKLNNYYELGLDRDNESLIKWVKANNNIIIKKLNEIIDYINKGDSNE